MKANDLLDLIGNADDKMIAEAKTTRKSRKNTWIKWGAMAACLCLVVVGIVTIPNLTDNAQDYAETVTYNNAQYVICGSGEADILRKCGLPTEIAVDLAGESLGCLAQAEKNNYVISENAKAGNFELFDYAPQPNDNVYIVRIEGNYYAAIRKDSKGYHGLTE